MKTYWKNLSKKQKSELAEKAGTSAEYLRQVFLYGRKPGYEITQKLELLTNIPKSKLRPDIYPPSEYLKAG